MSWGVGFFYYHCPSCGKKFKYAEDLLSYYQSSFGLCPSCSTPGVLEKTGPRPLDDLDYEEVEP